MVNRILAAYAVLLVMAFTLAGCTGEAPQGESKEPVRIGGAFALSGWAAAWGEEDMKGAILAIEEANARGGVRGHPIELVMEDTRSDSDATLTAVRALTDVEDIDTLLGPSWLETFGGGAAPLSDQGIIMMTPSGVLEAVELTQDYPYIYSTWYPLAAEVDETIEQLSAREQRRIVIVFGLTPYWDAWSAYVHERAPAYGIEIVQEFRLSNTDDFRTVIAKARDLEPQAVLFGFDTHEEILAFLKQSQELSLGSQLVGQEYLIPFIKDPEYAEMYEGILIVAPQTPIDRRFDASYEARFGTIPQYTARNSYDAARILIEALNSTDGSPAQVKTYIDEHMFNTSTYGMMRFREDGGVSGGAFVMYVVREGDLVLRT
jgi:branched-chain amino acid transport system substrate-binding protein